MDFSTTLKRFGVEQLIRYLHKDPEKNMLRLMDWADKFAKGEFVSQRKLIREAISNPAHPYYPFVRRLFTDLDEGVMQAMAANFFINAALMGWPKQEETREKYGCNIPWAILLDPTSACNLHCTGCWAAEYGNKLNLTFDEIDDIIRQGKELGIYMYIYTGGEPLVRKKDIIRLCEKHSDCEFLSFTNATLIDEAFADEMLRVKNFVPAISSGRALKTPPTAAAARAYIRRSSTPSDCCKPQETALTASRPATPAPTSIPLLQRGVLSTSSSNWASISSGISTTCPWATTPPPSCCPLRSSVSKLYRRIRKYRSREAAVRHGFPERRRVCGRLHRRRPALSAHQRQRRCGSLRVYPLFRFQHPREDAAGVPAVPHDDGIP